MNAAWPVANPTAAGARPAKRTAGGSSSHSTVVFVPTSTTITAPTTNPRLVPTRPRTTFWPVLSALLRSTASVPNTTQKPCPTPERSATRTERPRAAAPRRLLRSHSDCHPTWAPARSCAADSGPASPGGWRPRTRSSQLRRSAAAAKSVLRAICATTKLSSWARKLGSSAETMPRVEASSVLDRGSTRSGSVVVVARSRSASAACISASAACSASGERVGTSSRSAAASRVDAAAAFTAHARRSTWPPRGSGIDSTTIAFSQRSSSTSRTTARADVLSPVGR